MSHVLIYADTVQAAREAAAKTYIAAGGDPSKGWHVAADGGSTAAMGYNQRGRRWELHLPTLRADARLSPAEQDEITAFWIHEIGHSLYTDYAVWAKAVAAGVSHLVNALEDIRIEALIIKNGVAKNARTLLERLLNSKMLEAVSGATPYDPRDKRNIAWTIAAYGRMHCNGFVLTHAPAWNLGPNATRLITDAWDATGRAKSTADILAIALKLQAALKLPAGQAPGVTAGQPGQGQGQPGQGQGQPGQGQGQPGQGQGGATNGQPGSSGGTLGQAQASDGAMDVGDTVTDSAEPDLGSLSKRVNKRAGKRAATQADVLVSQWDLPPTMDAATMHGQGSHPQSVRKAESVLASVARLKRDVANVVKSVASVGVERFQAQGRMDRRAMSRAVAGQSNVYSRRTEDEGHETAVYISVDLSGSMDSREDQYVRGGSAVTLAQAAAAVCLAIGDTLDASGSEFAVEGFADPSGSHTTHNPLSNTMIIGKGFGQSWKRRRGLTARMCLETTSGTHAAGSILRGVHLLAARPERRKIVLVLTDGDDCSDGQAAMPAINAVARAKGVEVVGIGIFCNTVTRLYDTSHVATSVTGLSREGLGTLARVMKR